MNHRLQDTLWHSVLKERENSEWRLGGFGPTDGAPDAAKPKPRAQRAKSHRSCGEHTASTRKRGCELEPWV